MGQSSRPPLTCCTNAAGTLPQSATPSRQSCATNAVAGTPGNIAASCAGVMGACVPSAGSTVTAARVLRRAYRWAASGPVPDALRV